MNNPQDNKHKTDCNCTDCLLKTSKLSKYPISFLAVGGIAFVINLILEPVLGSYPLGFLPIVWGVLYLFKTWFINDNQ